MNEKELIEIYNKITKDYQTGRYTQEELSQKYNVPIEAIALCTRKVGYYHTKDKNGIYPFIEIDWLKTELEPLLRTR